ncbi:tRNA (uridine(34)/cytosine(34)/5-carboxymethylaminomethyluridine(34)-2'-O)-methyltransferase TrmL [Fusobacterium sp.]|uniref:tRNA (uridine(34)/cytosine(34)/5- carboxymethylaminomethyluridine(34)-2'-O)- methyltransferase TrmL n=1 Tax=Fusobacterium sp. TaxID=68766 RepID=UPI00396CDD5B
MNIVLYNPEIPYNTGNIGRTCVLTNTTLHLIKPLGFSLDEKQIKKAGLDYWKLVDLKVWESFEEFLEANPDATIYYATTKTKQKYSDVTYKENDFIMFGPESRGIPEEILNKNPERCITIPMIPMGRSLNLSNSAAIILYEGLRQLDFHYSQADTR